MLTDVERDYISRVEENLAKAFASIKVVECYFVAFAISTCALRHSR